MENDKILVIDIETRSLDIGTDVGVDVMRRDDDWPISIVRRIADHAVDIPNLPDRIPVSGPAPRRAPVPTTATPHVEDGASRASRRRMAKALAKEARK